MATPKEILESEKQCRPLVKEACKRIRAKWLAKEKRRK